jgi:23S rRNA-intervening sequence protein
MHITESIPANLAEGCGPNGDAEFARPVSELEYHLLLARDLKLLKPKDYEEFPARYRVEAHADCAHPKAERRPLIAESSRPQDFKYPWHGLGTGGWFRNRSGILLASAHASPV